MAKLTPKDTLRISKLAKLDLAPNEIDKFTSQLSAVLDLMDDLNSVNTKDIEPTAQTTGLENVVRDDEINVTKCLPQVDSFEVPQILHK